MQNALKTVPTQAPGSVRTLTARELPLFREHMLRLDRESRRDRFNGSLDDNFLARYAMQCVSDGTIILAYFEDGVVRGAAELHQPDLSPGSLPEIAFSVEACVRRQGVGSILFTRLIDKACSLGYESLRITTGAQNDAMRALANKFGAKLSFRHGESTGTIDLKQSPMPGMVAARTSGLDIGRALVDYNRACWGLVMKMYGLGKAS
ncbi:GNAT family N-acetyltransferase [Rhodopseudomonas sp. RCAM05734]|uniref:GNAT family N-acetyltransferase n=1 Tax=Rhodopseudomonas sp. RCAM05734 TaxID=3457549 RepID=UPI004044D93A